MADNLIQSTTASQSIESIQMVTRSSFVSKGKNNIQMVTNNWFHEKNGIPLVLRKLVCRFASRFWLLACGECWQVHARPCEWRPWYPQAGFKRLLESTDDDQTMSHSSCRRVHVQPHLRTSTRSVTRCACQYVRVLLYMQKKKSRWKLQAHARLQLAVACDVRSALAHRPPLVLTCKCICQTYFVATSVR